MRGTPVALPTSFFTEYSIAVTELLNSVTASACGCEDTFEATLDAIVDNAPPPPPPSTAYWAGPLGIEAELTGDGRYIQPESLRWEDLPLTLRYVPADTGAHQGAVVVGLITGIERLSVEDANARLTEMGADTLPEDTDAQVIWGTGDFDLRSEYGPEAARQVEEGRQNGVSMDLDDVAFEVRVAADAPALMTVDPQELAKTGTPDADGRVKVQEMAPDDEVMVTTDARIRAATIVSVPAFSRARIRLAPVAEPVPEAGTETLALDDLGDDPDDHDDGDHGMEPETYDEPVLERLAVRMGGQTFTVEYDPTETFNWVEDVGGLPKYIKRIEKAIRRKRPEMNEGHAIAIAVNAVKKMCATGDINFPGKQDVNPGSRAEACAAVAEWEAKKARAHADSAETATFRTSFAGFACGPKDEEDKRKKKFPLDAIAVTFGYDEGQWRNPKNGRWIDMPNVSLDKLADFFDVEAGGSLRDAPDSIREAVDSVVEQRGGMVDGPDSPGYAKAVETAAANLKNVDAAMAADGGKMHPEDLDTLETQIERVGLDLDAFKNSYTPGEDTDLTKGEGSDIGAGKSAVDGLSDAEIQNRLNEINPIANGKNGTIPEEAPDRIAAKEEVAALREEQKRRKAGDGPGNSIEWHWATEDNQQLTEDEWQAAKAAGLHPGRLYKADSGLVGIKGGNGTLEGRFDPETGAVYYKQNNGDWMQYGPGGVRKGEPGYPTGGAAEFYPHQTNLGKNEPKPGDAAASVAVAGDRQVSRPSDAAIDRNAELRREMNPARRSPFEGTDVTPSANLSDTDLEERASTGDVPSVDMHQSDIDELLARGWEQGDDGVWHAPDDTISQAAADEAASPGLDIPEHTPTPAEAEQILRDQGFDDMAISAMDPEDMLAEIGVPQEGYDHNPDGPYAPENPNNISALRQRLIDQGYDPATVAGMSLAEIQAALGLTGGDGSVTAAAAPVDPDAPPAAHFANPRFTGPTALTVDEDGRVYGHLAVWGTCHTSHTANGRCVVPPRSRTGYANFLTGHVVTAEGTRVSTGAITLDTGHADERFTLAKAAKHYDHTGTRVADVTMGEDAYGIWFSGSLVPGVTPAQVRTLRACPLSGDWRERTERRGDLELVAALAVNVQGFPVPRPKGLVASGGVKRSLVAAGMLPPRKVKRPGTPGAFSVEDLRYLQGLIQREKDHERIRREEALSKARALSIRMRADALAARLRSM